MEFPQWNASKTEIDTQWVSDHLKVDCVSCTINTESAQVKGMSGANMDYMVLELKSGEKLPIVIKETHSQFAKSLGLTREAHFYKHLQATIDIKTPKVYYTFCVEEEGHKVMIMEDLSHLV